MIIPKLLSSSYGNVSHRRAQAVLVQVVWVKQCFEPCDKGDIVQSMNKQFNFRIVYMETYVNIACKTFVQNQSINQSFGYSLYSRVSVIMQSVKARLFRINDSQLYKKVCLLLMLCIIYLTSWTITTSKNHDSPQCVLMWWDIAIAAGKVSIQSQGWCFMSRLRVRVTLGQALSFATCGSLTLKEVAAYE